MGRRGKEGAREHYRGDFIVSVIFLSHIRFSGVAGNQEGREGGICRTCGTAPGVGTMIMNKGEVSSDVSPAKTQLPPGVSTDTGIPSELP